MRGCDIQGSLVIIGLSDSFESYFPEIKFALDFTDLFNLIMMY